MNDLVPSSLLNSFKAFPKEIFDHPLVRSHHIDTAMAVLGVTRLEESPRHIHMPDAFGTYELSMFTSINRNNLASYLRDLETFGFLHLQREGPRREITRIKWSRSTHTAIMR